MLKKEFENFKKIYWSWNYVIEIPNLWSNWTSPCSKIPDRTIIGGYFSVCDKYFTLIPLCDKGRSYKKVIKIKKDNLILYDKRNWITFIKDENLHKN